MIITDEDKSSLIFNISVLPSCRSRVQWPWDINAIRYVTDTDLRLWVDNPLLLSKSDKIPDLPTKPRAAWHVWYSEPEMIKILKLKSRQLLKETIQVFDNSANIPFNS